jgi:hypothetical protein
LQAPDANSLDALAHNLSLSDVVREGFVDLIIVNMLLRVKEK